MLLEFRTQNYRSFKNEMIFSMSPAQKQKDLEYSIQKERIGRNVYKALSSAIIYGPNAAGKTNIIGAMDTFRSILMRGNILNSENISSPNVASYKMELIPFYGTEGSSPVKFYIKFIDNNILFEYEIIIDIGEFLDNKYERKILNETLSINNKQIFKRDEKLYIDNIESIREYLNNSVENNIESANIIAQSGLNITDLFLTNGFKSIYSIKLVNLIIDWITNKFMIIYRADAIQISKNFADPKEKTVYIEKTLSDAAEEFGINSNALGFVIEKEGTEATLCSIINKDHRSVAIPAETFESYGTIRFINEFPLVIRALITGSILVIDEFDASIHPMALMNIINIFHNDDININHAQLVFNTHNPIFLNASLFRRDEIKFVERDDITHESKHYSLADFKTFGKNGVRKGEDYMKHYFVSRFGAIKEVDFSSILELILLKKGEDQYE